MIRGCGGGAKQAEERELSLLRLSSGGKAATSLQSIRAVSLRQVLEMLRSYLYAGIFSAVSWEMQE